MPRGAAPSWRCDGRTIGLLLLSCLMVSLCGALPFENEQQEPPPPPFTLAQKKELCGRDYWGYNQVLELLTVDPEPREELMRPSPLPNTTSQKYPRIFCYVNTISPYHKTHAQLVADTWAQRCDKTVFFSNTTGALWVNKGTSQEISFDVVKMHAPADYNHLWMKHREVLKYIYDHYRHEYDWFYKADDDAYLIVDNLRAYLRRPEIVNNHKRQPMHIGKRLNVPMANVETYFPDKRLRAQWLLQWDRMVFNSGGPGYALNRLFLDKFVLSMENKKCLSAKEAEQLPEDTSTTFCLMWHDVVPWDTRDLKGRPRWHAYNPGNSYGAKPEPGKESWLVEYSKNIGGYKYGDDCCAPDSIGFHYVKQGGMHHLERTMYFCRTGDDVPDIETFNRKYNLRLSHELLKYRNP